MHSKSNFQSFSLKLAKNVLSYAIAIVIFDLLGFSVPVFAQTSASSSDSGFETCTDLTVSDNQYSLLIPKVKRIKSDVVITAYNSENSQTDDSPCITANGYNLCKNGKEDSIAANFLPFGAKVRIPELFGDRVFTVRDRMHRRFSNRVDVWMVERSKALAFGLKTADIEIIE